MSAQPTVDHQYWFDYSKKLIDDALEKRNEAAAALQKLVLWLWGIYTGATAIGFALSEKSLALGPTLWIVSASAALILVYWATVWVQMPVTQSFDPRSPTQIRAAHADAVARKRTRLFATLALALVAAVLVAVAIAVAAVAEPEPETPPSPEFALSPVLERGEGGAWALQLATKLPGVTKARVRVLPQGEGDAQAFHEQPYSLLEGILLTTIPFEAPRDAKLRVELEWDDANGVEVQIAKNLEASTPGAGARP